MQKKIAIIVGASWQDGTILTELLQSSGYALIALSRTGIRYIGMESWVEHIDILNPTHVQDLVSTYTPDELYYLAAYHHAAEEKAPEDSVLYGNSRAIHCDGYFNFLRAVSAFSPHTRVCYASSCLIYEGSATTIQNEETLPVPLSPYAITKLEWMHLWKWYMHTYGVSVVNAILYNHESEYREKKFLSMKVILGAKAIVEWRQSELIIWNAHASIDQWSAWDYCRAMHMLVQNHASWDFILASGERHTVQDLLEIVFSYYWLEWSKYVRISDDIQLRKTGILHGDTSKIFSEIWWKPSQDYTGVIREIIQKVS